MQKFFRDSSSFDREIDSLAFWYPKKGYFFTTTCTPNDHVFVAFFFEQILAHLKYNSAIRSLKILLINHNVML